ncbi:GNAT family N-acetyltransferase [Thalassotalea sp. G2M2-11]|uniref:GNAT family N-acetyltransferase n=1 Tax=Thalassotalea sp. G2M2-11 TaxID=2787627 RepID=UPI0019D29C66|nr:GNAT family N-acetyltransferase [Thalassotalea sp. G2M2-11]
MTIICKKIENIKQLMALEPQWVDLNHRVNDGCIFTSPKWITTWYDTFWQMDWHLNCLAIFRNKKLIALFPLYYQFISSGLTEKKLFLLGQGEPDQSEVATEYPDILIEPKEKEVVYPYFLKSYCQRKFDSIHIRAVKPNANILEFLKVEHKLSGYQYTINNQQWDKSLLSKNNRNRYARCKNQLAKLNSKFVWIEPQDYPIYWHQMSKYHQARWQKKHLHGAFFHQDFHQFHHYFIEDKNNIRISALLVNEVIIAVNYYLVDKNTLYFYQSGWNESSYDKLSPGFALHVWSIENNNKLFYDLMMGPISNTYKNKFKPFKRPLYDVHHQFKPIKHLILKVLRKIISI